MKFLEKVKSKLGASDPELHRRALRRSFFSSIGRLIGVGLGAGAGSLLHELLGGGFKGWGAALVMAGASFFFIWFAEYEREVD